MPARVLAYVPSTSLTTISTLCRSEANHDTIIDTADDGMVSSYGKEYSYRALVSARAHLSRAVEVYVTPTGGQTDGRILVEVSTRDHRDSPKG